MSMIRKLFFLGIVVLFAACSSNGDEEFKKTLSKGTINSSEINMHMTVEDIENKFGKPEEEQTVLDWGYYGYKDFGIFFTNKFSNVIDGEIVKTKKEENSIAFIRWFKNISIFGLIVDFSDKDKVFAELGHPDEKYIIFPEDEYGGLFAGSKMKYISGKYSVIVNIDNNDKVADIILGPSDLKM